jgi:hypothetical protein
MRKYKDLFFTVKGVKFMKVGTRKCDNDSWQHDIKNCVTGKYSKIGDEKLERILNNLK